MERWRILHKTSNFTVVDNGIFNDPDLTYEEIGLLCSVLSLPEGWHFNIKGIVSKACEGRDHVYSIINRLIEHGYCKREQSKDAKTGRWQNYDYTFFEVKNGLGCASTPQTPLPDTDSPDTGSPYTENPTLLNTINNKVTNRENTKGRGVFTPPTLQDTRSYWQERTFSSDPDEFWAHFTNCDWKLSSGKGAKMKDWRLAAIAWEKREKKFNHGK